MTRAGTASMATMATLGVAALVAACAASSGGGDAGTQQAQSCASLVAPSACPSPAPSWKGQVQALFEGYCLQCHGSTGVAFSVVPMATYEDVAANRTRIWEAIYNCSMPGGQDAGVTPLAYPTIAQRTTMLAWADACGAPNN